MGFVILLKMNWTDAGQKGEMFKIKAQGEVHEVSFISSFGVEAIGFLFT